MAGYTITSVQQTQRIASDGHLVDYVDVTFTVADDIAAGSVEVPMTTGWQDAAHAAVQVRADELAAFVASQA